MTHYLRQPVAIAIVIAIAQRIEPVTAQRVTPPPIVGRWDLTVNGTRASYASWLEVEQSGFRWLVGRFTGRIGGVRPIGRVDWTGDTVRFSIPPQWQVVTDSNDDLRLEARLTGDQLTGTISNPTGLVHTFTGVRAPTLKRDAIPTAWEKPRPMITGSGLNGWHADNAGPSRWSRRAGVLVNDDQGANLVSDELFDDFKLHAEFRYPKAGISALGLRGRYRLKLRDETARDLPTRESAGGIYGFITPSEIAVTVPGEWQSVDVTLIGRHVTVVLNGIPVVTNQIIAGLTGSAVDANEGAPGPIVLQGEESAFEFRNITVQRPRR